MGDASQSELRDWYSLVKHDAPVSAVGVASLAIGLFLLVLSGGMEAPAKDILLFISKVMLGVGCTGFALGIIVLTIKSLRR